MEKIWFKNYSKNIPHDIPEINKSLVTLFEETCERHKHLDAFISFDTKMTYGELHKKVLMFASFLQNEAHLKKGDVIIIQSPNLLTYPISLWAALYSGLTIVNMNPLYSPREMKEQIKDSKAKAIVLFSSCVSRLEEIVKDTQLESIIVTQPGDLLNSPKKQIINFVFKYIQRKTPLSHSLPHSIDFLKALHQGESKPPKKREKGLDETVFLQYTGGTTGVSKGVELTQRNILSNVKQCEVWITYALKRGEGMALNALPMYHIFSLVVNGFLLFLHGIGNVMQANPRQIPLLVSTIKKYPMVVFIGVNTLFKSLLRNPQFQKIDFSSLKFSIAGGMALESSVQRQWVKTTKTFVIEGYGLTEASPVICCNSLENPKDGFAGLPLPSTEIRIVNEEGEEQGLDQEGELEARGPQVMKGYLNHSEETKKVLSSDGWLKTGDIASVNSEGLVKILDRKKDMINVSGFNIYPNEVEDVISSHEKVKDVAVVGIADEISSEAVKAVIVTDDPSLTEKEIRTYCKTKLAAYKVPCRIDFVKEIPKTTIGKPIRYKLK